MNEEVVQGGNSAPATFEEAFAADATPASDPASTSSSSPAGAESQPTETAVPGTTVGQSDDDRSPFIPRARFDEVNTKYRDAQSWKEQHAWAEQYNPQHVDTMRQWFARAQADPRGFAFGLLDELAAHPEYGAAVRSEFARRLGTRNQAGHAEEMPTPDVEITDANGRVIGRTYSDQQLLKRDAYLKAQLMKDMAAQFEPHVQTLQSIESERKALAEQRQAHTFANEFVTELSALPLFQSHKAEIARAVQAMRLSSDHPDAVRAATYRAYHQIVVPKLTTGSQQAAVADFQRKAAASTGINPAASPQSTSQSPRSFHDLKASDW